MSYWEILAVAMGIVYLLLAMRENSWCWLAALIETCIFSSLFFQAKLYMESGLEIYYAAMAIYGWWHWRYSDKTNHPIRIARWSRKNHLLALSSIFILSAISGILLSKNTQATFPFLDSIVTWGSIITTYMATRKILENWLYWITLDSLAMCLYFNKGLYLTTGLFGVYIALAILGYYRWLKTCQAQAHPAYLPAVHNMIESPTI